MTEEVVIRGFIASRQAVPPLLLNFQFNPTSISDNKAVRYTEVRKEQTGNAPSRSYQGGGDRTVSFNFTLHATEPGMSPTEEAGSSLLPQLATLRSFMYPRTTSVELSNEFILSLGGKTLSDPPTCVFGFGSRVLECWMTSLDIKETQFNARLEPTRADVTITLIVIEEESNPFYQTDRAQRVALVARHSGQQTANVGQTLAGTLGGG